MSTNKVLCERNFPSESTAREQYFHGNQVLVTVKGDGKAKQT